MEKIIEISEGYEARIEGNKVVLEPKEGEDERIRNEMLNSLKEAEDSIVLTPFKKKSWIAYLEKQKEQKPVDYAEELKKCKDNPLYFFDKYVSIKLKKPAEWSEEDEIRLKEAIEVLDESIKYLPMGYGFIKDVNLVKNWLKSLRPQPQWKPSEEQMEWLEQAVRLSADRSAIHGTILSLYNALRQL